MIEGPASGRHLRRPGASGVHVLEPFERPGAVEVAVATRLADRVERVPQRATFAIEAHLHEPRRLRRDGDNLGGEPCEAEHVAHREGRRRRTVGIGARSIVVLVVATSPSRIIQVEHPAKALRQHRPAMGAL